MKKNLILVFAFLLGTIALKSEWKQIDSWFENVDGAFSFVIDGKPYVGGGTYTATFSYYDVEAENWVQLGDLPFGPRAWAYSFAVNGKAYVGGGDPTGQFNVQSDLWEYDPGTDSWTQMPDFPGGGRDGCVAFAIGDKGYVGAGFDGQYILNDFYQFDPQQKKWTKISNFPEAAIFLTCFVINGKGYATMLGQGFDKQSNKIYEFNPSTNMWTAKKDFPGEARQCAAAFVYEGKAYVGGGQSSYSKKYNDVYSFDPVKNNWTEEIDMVLPYDNTAWPTAFQIDGTAYFGLGASFPNLTFTNKFYKWELVPKPEIEVSTTYLNFTSVIVGQTKQDVFTVSNTGSVALTITDINIDNAVFTHAESLPIEIAAGESREITVTFAPDAIQEYNAVLKIVSNASNGTETEVYLAGQGISDAVPNAEISVESVDFGTTDILKVNTKTITITNSGSGELELSDVYLDDSEQNFSVDVVTLPHTLTASESIDIIIHFEASHPGSYATDLIVETNDPENMTITIPLSANVIDTKVIEIDDSELDLQILNRTNTLEIYITSQTPLSAGELSISDIRGNIVFRGTVPAGGTNFSVELDKHKLAKGVYFIGLSRKDELYQKKILISE